MAGCRVERWAFGGRRLAARPLTPAAPASASLSRVASLAGCRACRPARDPQGGEAARHASQRSCTEENRQGREQRVLSSSPASRFRRACSMRGPKPKQTQGGSSCPCFPCSPRRGGPRSCSSLAPPSSNLRRRPFLSPARPTSTRIPQSISPTTHATQPFPRAPRLAVSFRIPLLRSSPSPAAGAHALPGRNALTPLEPLLDIVSYLPPPSPPLSGHLSPQPSPSTAAGPLSSHVLAVEPEEEELDVARRQQRRRVRVGRRRRTAPERAGSAHR